MAVASHSGSVEPADITGTKEMQMFTGLLIGERAAVRRSDLLDDARRAHFARRARGNRRVVREHGPCAAVRRGWLRSAIQPQSD
jgi:hypothetical protein